MKRFAFSVLVFVAAFVQPAPPEPAPAPVPVPTPPALVAAIEAQDKGALTVLDASGSTGATSFAWTIIPDDPGFEIVDGGRRACFASNKAGVYHIVLAVGGKDGGVALDVEEVQRNPPPEPIPPGPGPGPVPPPDPPPGPGPSPAPIPEAGYRVLIIEETADRGKLPKSQVTVLASTTLREYLNAKCAKGPDGKTPEWRQFDDDVDLKNESSIWQAALKRERASLPWIIISTGKSGFEGPLPTTEDDALKLLKKYGDAP